MIYKPLFLLNNICTPLTFLTCSMPVQGVQIGGEAKQQIDLYYLTVWLIYLLPLNKQIDKALFHLQEQTECPAHYPYERGFF